MPNPLNPRTHAAPAGYSDRLYNDDLAPAKERTWRFKDLFALWMSFSHSIAGYTQAASLFVLGLGGWQVFVALVLGNLIICAGMIATGVAGQRVGVPYAVFTRISFGVFGANVTALIRAVMAMVWYGIQTYLASVAVVVLLLRLAPSLRPLAESDFLGLSALGWISFLGLWAAQLAVLRRGMETVRRVTDFAGPAVWVVMLALAVWVVVEASGHVSLNLNVHGKPFDGNSVIALAAAIALVVAPSAPILNFADFARFAPSRRSVVRSSLLGLPTNSVAFSVVSVIVTTGTVAIFGRAIFDPVELVAQFHSTAVLVLGAATFAIATIGINVIANFVSPAYDLANLAPKYIDFKRGGLITAVLAIVVMPWKIYTTPVAINYFLGGVGAMIGPIFGVIMVDYYLVRRGTVVVDDLYRETPDGAYYYHKGVNPRALAALIPSALVAMAIALTPALHAISPFSWVVGVLMAGCSYYILAARGRRTTPAQDTQPEPLAEA